MKWTTLRSLGTNPLVRSANVWAFIVPVAAKVLDKVQDTVTVHLLGEKVSFYLELPFSWKVLFVAAIAFLIGNVVFALFCPSLIKETESFRDFSDQGRSIAHVGDEFMAMVRDKNTNDVDEKHAFLFNWFSTRGAYRFHNDQNAPRQSDSVDARQSADAYAKTVAFLNEKVPEARFGATLVYMVGLGAVAVIVVQNIWFVSQHW